VAHLQGAGCPACKNKTEGKLFPFLLSLFSDTIYDYRADFCRNPDNHCHLPYDFYIPSLKTIVELDGIQHYKQVSDWLNPTDCNIRDCFKIKQALKNGLTVIRLCQQEVYSDTNNWKINLKNALSLDLAPTLILMSDNILMHNAFRNISKSI